MTPQLERLAGTWQATETLHPSPWAPAGGSAEATLVARLALGGLALLMDYRREGRFAYEGLGVMLFDAREHGHDLWWFDTLGPPAPAKGGVGGAPFVFEGPSAVGRARTTYAFVRDGEFTFKVEHSRDGKEWRTFLDARYVRRAPPPAAPL